MALFLLCDYVCIAYNTGRGIFFYLFNCEVLFYVPVLKSLSFDPISYEDMKLIFPSVPGW